MLKRSLFVLLGLSLAAPVAFASDDAAGAPTFTKDVAPIVYEKCAKCHRPGQIAPMSLLSYTDARPWARSIAKAVATRDMPPWHVDAQHSLTFKNDPSMTQEQIDTIVAWAEGGAPKGNDADLPPEPTFGDDVRWTFGEPDYIFEMPIDFALPAEGEIPVMSFYSKIPFEEDRFVEVLELRPSEQGVLHHAGAFIVDLPEGAEIVDGQLVEADDPRLRDERAAQRVFSRAGTSKLISYVPGRGTERHKPGTAKRIPAGQYIRWSMHYQTNGKETFDRTQLGVWFNTKPVTHEILNRSSTGLETQIAEGVEIPPVFDENDRRERGKIPNIPAYAENWQLTQIDPIPEAITLYGMSPHMHLRGKDVKYIVTYPDGREQTILWVPEYSFEWQHYYELETPLKIPAGSKLTSIAHFDNSLNNPYNPGPHLEVYWAEQSWDEMFGPQVRIAIDSQDLTKKGTDEE